ncbi:MAG TPA: TetR/AcrR family transcriptional regulator [Acidimicrobiia bacterium]|nr:TetR/AcrR family transcriptional regulator [Acidimicrobiia bacterium]
MAARSQDPSFETSGRVNQKRRTRAAIVAAARAIVERGDHPTVAQAAEEALVSRTTAYRYFPTQESLLLELSVTVSIDGVGELLARPAGESTPEQRLVALVDVFTGSIAEHEALFRAAQRHYLDTWLAAERSGAGHEQPVREGRRREWIAAVLEPVRERMPAAEWQRLQAALCLVIGGEAFTVLRDVCHLEPDEAIAVAKWAAQAILAVGAGDSLPPD